MKTEKKKKNAASVKGGKKLDKYWAPRCWELFG